MKPKQQFLCALLKTIQIGKIEIRSLLDCSMDSALRRTLENQLQEYDFIETEVFTIALQRGWSLMELDPCKKVITDKLTRLKLKRHNTDSSIADILIRGNTKGMIQGLKNLHQLPMEDRQLQVICQKLLDCETAHIRQMQFFL